MSVDNLLTEERRARMAAEKLLAQKQAELNDANRMLSRHARHLSEDLVETREEMVEVREDLERATVEVDIAKRRLWSSIETVEDGFAVFDEDSRLVIANPAYYAPFDGLACIRPGVHYEEIVEAALSEGVVDTGPRTAPEWRDWMLARWAQDDPEPRQIRLWNGAYVRLVDRRAPGGDTVSMALDVTQAIRRQNALRAARERAEAANRAKSAFLANMSHEIRTPMNGVVGMADLMAEHDLDEELSTYVDTIRSSGRALLTIINDVLDYSKIEAAKLELHAETFDLEQTILDVIALLMPSVREKGLKLMLDYDMFLPTRYEGDPVRVRQILTNLIGNAVKFTAEGHVLVRVLGVPDRTEGRERVHVTIEDTGIGIAPDMQGHVFGEFNQVEGDSDRAFEGTGLGLAITRQLVELMGGEIWVESEAGVGSCFGFTISLPRVEEEALPEVPQWLDQALLVMADDMNRAILAKRLLALGIRVEQVETVEDGQALAETASVIFVDQKLLRAEHADLCANAPAPVITVSDPLADDRACNEDRVLRKPHSRPALMAQLTALPEPQVPGFRTRRAATQDNVFAEMPGVSPDTDDDGWGDSDAEWGEAAPEPLSPPPATPVTPAPRRMRVLCAEDNKTNRFVFSKLVKACDIDLSFAENGFEAVDAFEEAQPDLIFMDISMPGMDGKEATRRIRRLEGEGGLTRTRIVALTAHAMTGDGDDIMAHGLDAHLTKPFPKDMILAEIAAACPEGALAPLPREDAQAAS
ncbi:ATP-binding protein [Maritimibacter sp. UBA3975]|uniref:ATP-binding protein n=1 Tax=Maritimibacter sp. UBA3975 TaxID=1946833 RepID=UPI000C0B6222|nr:ATP-binding protein [Maritimibacter sp. UBA3975]MAM63664.1 hybrid sensor histidine kinase/response regulator [Maritimibacter sp.]|tara:strand:- start:16861 stop:19128 length:2268 start_codon:yes stop_codon:yes gene_type:complete